MDDELLPLLEDHRPGEGAPGAALAGKAVADSHTAAAPSPPDLKDALAPQEAGTLRRQEEEADGRLKDAVARQEIVNGEKKPNIPGLGEGEKRAEEKGQSRSLLEEKPKKPVNADKKAENAKNCDKKAKKCDNNHPRTAPMMPTTGPPARSLEPPEILAKQARDFAKSAAGSSMAVTADAFRRAAEDFARGKGRKERVADTALNGAAMLLFAVAERADSEAGLTGVAIDLTHRAQMLLLSDSRKQTLMNSMKQRLRGAISARDPILPIYAENEKQLVDKREVLYALALAAPLAILTAAAGGEMFHGAWAWVAGASAGVWVLAASGMIVNQYAVLDCERLGARHLGRLGVLGAAMLFCFFTYRDFFPSAHWALGLLLGITALFIGVPWVMSCIRGDDVISASTEIRGDDVISASTESAWVAEEMM